MQTQNAATGDYDLRGRDLAQVFASPKLSDAALTACTKPRNPEMRGFPAYQIFARIVRGDVLYDRELYEWVAGTVRLLVRARSKARGRPYVNNPGQWCVTAGQDAMAYIIHQRWPLPASVRATQYDISEKTFRRVRDPIAGGILLGLNGYIAELTGVYHEVQRYDRSLDEAFNWAVDAHYQ